MVVIEGQGDRLEIRRLDVADRPTAAEYDALMDLFDHSTTDDHCSRPLLTTTEGADRCTETTRRSPRGQRCAVRPPAVLRTADGRPLLRPLTISSIGETSRRAPAVRGTADGRTAARPIAASARHRQRGEGLTFEHRPVMVDEIVAALAPVPPGVLVDATVGGGGHAAALLDGPPATGLVGPRPRRRRPRRRRRAALARFGDRVTLRRARFDALTATLQELGHARDLRRALRPRRLLPAARRRRPRLLLPKRRTTRHAHGPTPATHGSRRGERLRRPTSWRGCCAPTATSASPPASPGRSSPPARCTTTTELADVVRDAIPAAGPPHRRPPGQAHLPGRAHRGQRGARRSWPTRSTRPSTSSPPVAAARCSPTTRARTGS